MFGNPSMAIRDYMGGCQDYDHFLDPYKTTAPNI